MCNLPRIHRINTVTFSKCNDLGHYLNGRCSDFHLCYYIIIYEVVSHVFSDSYWVSEPCKQPLLMMADLTDRRSDTNPCINITGTPRQKLWSSMVLTMKHAWKGKEDWSGLTFCARLGLVLLTSPGHDNAAAAALGCHYDLHPQLNSQAPFARAL